MGRDPRNITYRWQEKVSVHPKPYPKTMASLLMVLILGSLLNFNVHASKVAEKKISKILLLFNPTKMYFELLFLVIRAVNGTLPLLRISNGKASFSLESPMLNMRSLRSHLLYFLFIHRFNYSNWWIILLKGPTTKHLFAYRFYNPDEVILGKAMRVSC